MDDKAFQDRIDAVKANADSGDEHAKLELKVLLDMKKSKTLLNKGIGDETIIKR